MEMDRVFHLRDAVGRLSSEPTEERYWIREDDGSPSEDVFCKNCAEEHVKTLANAEIDGGWACESDYMEECALCGVRLRCWPTDYAAREEIKHAQQHKPEDPEDWWALRWAMEGIVSRDPLWETIEGLLTTWGLVVPPLG